LRGFLLVASPNTHGASLPSGTFQTNHIKNCLFNFLITPSICI
jgi:hypothetical protein